MTQLKTLASSIAFLVFAGLTLSGCWLPLAAPTPPGAEAGSVHLNDLACPSATVCVAVASYDFPPPNNTSGQAYVETLSQGTWSASVPSLPTDADGMMGTLFGVSCISVGSCVAVGTYEESPGVHEPLVETLSDGTWTPLQAPLPSDAAIAPQYATLGPISCASDGTCVATGSYYLTGQHTPIGLVETLTGGSWTAMVTPLPPGATGTPPTGQPSCSSVSTCFIVSGQYYDVLSGSQWLPGTFPVPAGEQVAYMDNVSCVLAGTCVAIGSYGGVGSAGPLFETYADSGWTPTLAPMPNSASADDLLRLSNIDCITTASCVVIGTYQTGPGADALFSETLTANTWTTSSIPLPPLATAGSFGALSCDSGPTCSAVGSYGNGQLSFGFTTTLSDGVWKSADAVVPIYTLGLQGSSFSAVACPTSARCYAIGGYGAEISPVANADPMIETELLPNLP